MDYRSSILTLMFFLAFCIYFLWGISIIRINPKGKVNKAFFALSIFLCIWSFGYSMANSAIHLETALFWKRISAIGKIFSFSTMLHFILLLVNKDVSIKRKRLFMLVHIPAFINSYIFTFSSTMVSTQYNIMKIDYGWINKPVNNIWNFLYYILYIISSLVVVSKWKKKSKRKSITKQVNLFFITFIGAIIAGSFTDIVGSSIFKNPLLQMTPLFALFPVWAMYYSAKYYDVLNIEKVKKEEIIMSDKQQKNIFINLSIVICISGVLVFVFEYFSSKLGSSSDLKISFISGELLFILGLSILIIQKFKKESLKETLTIVILVSSIPIFMFQFLNYSTITVWVFPIILINSSLLFNKRTLLISTTIVAIITQRLVWLLMPESYVLVNKYDYILRIMIFLILFLMGSYINRIYITKVKENKYQFEFQKMVSEVSFEFVSSNQKNFDQKVNNLLEKVGHFFHVDRIYLLTINYNNKTIIYSNKWCNNELNEEVATMEEIPLDTFPWWIDQLKKNNLVSIEDVDSMPEEASAEKEQLHKQNVKSVVSVPIMDEGKIQAFIRIDSVLGTKKWSKEKIGLLNIMTNILSSGITQIKTDKKIEFMAYYDNLTKLPNQFLFADKVNQAIELSKKTGKFISIIFIDLNNFKSVNDTIGHKGGDILLKQVAKSLVKVLNKTDIVARFGGDKFMIMLNNINDYAMITKTADKIMQIFSETFLVNNQEFLITANAGITIYPIDGEESEMLVKNADIAMYKAKAKGNNQYALCSKDMKEEVKLNIELSNDLYRALERNELVVYYQPQIDLVTKKVTGLEALLRWMHPTRGMISPSVFIPLAEKNSLINSIGEWVFKTACVQNKNWQDKGLPHTNIAINLSAIQMMNPKLPANIESIVHETGLDPKYIELEITESIAIKETNYVIAVLNKLKKIGISIAIDDFGTEYSSLIRLKLLPIDRIKIDMQFIQGLESNEKDKAITMVIINLAKCLGIKVLAEGVETENQLDFLNQKMCDNVQGFFYYKPMPAREIEKILVDLSRKEDKDTFKCIPINPIPNIDCGHIDKLDPLLS